MCFDRDSRPPIAPLPRIAGGALEAGPLVLTSEDGTRFNAFRAVAPEPTGAGILILPDVRGLHPYFEELAQRFAERGVDALAIDYFGRTAGTSPRGDEFDHAPHVSAATWEGLSADVRTGIATLRAPDWNAGRSPTSLFATGFCMGGRLTFLSATLGLGLRGVIGFYGWPVGPHRTGMPAPADLAPQIECPVLALWAGADQGISAAVVDEFETALTRAGIDHRSITYPDAPHSFFDRKAAEFADASAAAWDETLGFIRDHTG